MCLLARAEHQSENSPDKPAVWLYVGGELNRRVENLRGRRFWLLAGQASCLAGCESRNAARLLKNKEMLLSS